MSLGQRFLPSCSINEIANTLLLPEIIISIMNVRNHQFIYFNPGSVSLLHWLFQTDKRRMPVSAWFLFEKVSEKGNPFFGGSQSTAYNLFRIWTWEIDNFGNIHIMLEILSTSRSQQPHLFICGIYLTIEKIMIKLALISKRFKFYYFLYIPVDISTHTWTKCILLFSL